MKLSIMLALLFASVTLSSKVFAQSYCGISYTYDVSGGRNHRAPIICEEGPGGGGGSGKRDVTENDTITNKTAQIVLLQTMFPNPTAGSVNIAFNESVDNAEISVSDNLGKKLFSKQASGSTLPLDLSNYSSGTYIITVKVRGRTFQNSVVKN